MYKAIFIDIDGTLRNQNRELTQKKGSLPKQGTQQINNYIKILNL